ncbi:MAG TPA: plasmid maintenance system killer protein [Prevotella sp.]|nr:plasmid maintenance system killer protein [Prevotella sp.]
MQVWEYHIMNIDFKDKALEELYTSGRTKDHKYSKLAPDVIKRYAKVVNFLRSARRLEDLFLIKSLHYEKKEGDLNGVDAVWITHSTGSSSIALQMKTE